MARKVLLICDEHDEKCPDQATVSAYPFLVIEEQTQEPLEEGGEVITVYVPRIMSVDICDKAKTAHGKMVDKWAEFAIPSEEFSASRIGTSAPKKSGTGSTGGVPQKYDLTATQTAAIKTWAMSNKVQIDGKEINDRGRIGAKWVERYCAVYPEKKAEFGVK